MSALPLSDVSGRLTRLTRLKNSINGNPRWELQIDAIPENGVPAILKTKVDAAISYELSPAWEGRAVRVERDARGHVVGAWVSG